MSNVPQWYPSDVQVPAPVCVSVIYYRPLFGGRTSVDSCILYVGTFRRLPYGCDSRENADVDL